MQISGDHNEIKNAMAVTEALKRLSVVQHITLPPEMRTPCTARVHVLVSTLVQLPANDLQTEMENDLRVWSLVTPVPGLNEAPGSGRVAII